jgi:hypothetical protein
MREGLEAPSSLILTLHPSKVKIFTPIVEQVGKLRQGELKNGECKNFNSPSRFNLQFHQLLAYRLINWDKRLCKLPKYQNTTL